MNDIKALPTAPLFPGFADPHSNFDTSRDQLRARPFYVDVDLSTARSVAAGTGLNLPISGNVFYIDQKANSGNARIRFDDQTVNGTPLTVYAGFVTKIPYTQIALENDAQAGVTMRIIFGTDLDFLPTSAAGVTILNALTVYEPDKVRSAAQQSFFGQTSATPGAGLYGNAQLWNPAASGKSLYVRRIKPTILTAANSFTFGKASAQCVNLLANRITNKNFIAAAAASVAEMRNEANAAQLLATTTAGWAETSAAVDGRDIVLYDPIVVPPGTGLTIVPNNVLIALTCALEWYEQ